MAPAPLVMLPGLLCDEAVWSRQWRALNDRDCFVPSFGDLNTIGAMASHVLEIAPADRFALAGHSMGGRVAMEMVRQAPQRIERLALLDTGMDPPPQGEAFARERAQRLTLLAIARSDGMRTMGRHWTRGMVHPERLGSKLFHDILDMVERKTVDVFEAQIDALLDRPDARPVLAGLRIPTLLLCGREDTWSPLSRHLQMKALVSHARLVVVGNAGHMTTMEQPDAVSEALAQWLSDTGED